MKLGLRPTLRVPRRLHGGDLAGFLTGLFCYAIFLNYIEYGPDGPKAWFRAKFLNDVSLGQSIGVQHAVTAQQLTPAEQKQLLTAASGIIPGLP
jgi:hypothetical protein